MAAGVCLIFLIPYCAENRENFDDEMRILTKKTDNDEQEKEKTDFKVIKNEKSGLSIERNDVIESDLISNRSRYCIFPCLPVRSRSGIEEGKYCRESVDQDGNSIVDDKDIKMVQKMSVI